jgi:hypothetical protein
MRLRKENVKRNDCGIERKERGSTVVRNAAFAGALLLGSTIVGCTHTQTPAPQSVPVTIMYLDPAESAFSLRCPETRETQCVPGTRQSPFRLYPRERRELIGPGSIPVIAPFVFNLEGTQIHFSAHLTASQLRPENRSVTISELNIAVRDRARAYMKEHNISIDGKISVSMGRAVYRWVHIASRQDSEMRRYLETTRTSESAAPAVRPGQFSNPE